MVFINKDLEKFNQMSISFIEFAGLVYDNVETNSENKEYLKEALPYLKSLLETIRVLRGQFFSGTSLRPINYDLIFLSKQEEIFLNRYSKLEKIFKDSYGS
jgi:hypothetical protein